MVQATIRDEIELRCRDQGRRGLPAVFSILCAYVGICALVAYLVFLAIRHRVFAASAGEIYVPLFALALVAFFVGIVRSRPSRRLTCPKCDGSLSDFVVRIIIISNKRPALTINHCPYCGVGFDDPMPEAASPADDGTRRVRLLRGTDGL
jgi:hypothetical protein